MVRRSEPKRYPAITQFELANTILHEVNHAILDDKGVNLEFALDEQVVQGMTNGQIAFIKDNPDLFRMLLELMGV